MPEQKVLVVEDDRFMSNMIRDLLVRENYQVSIAFNCNKAIRHIYKNTPDLILLDIILPSLNGLEFCRILRNDLRTSQIPIIMLTSKSSTTDKVKGLEAGADDYITKPFEPREFIARVKTHLRRAEKEKHFNPLTGLPGNKLIRECLQKHLNNPDQFFAVLYINLNNFKSYNNDYGFFKGDEVLKMLGDILRNCILMYGSPSDFIGHLGKDEFIVITTSDRISFICNEIQVGFSSRVPLLYPQNNQKKGESKIMSLSIVIVTNTHEKKLLLTGKLLKN